MAQDRPNTASGPAQFAELVPFGPESTPKAQKGKRAPAAKKQAGQEERERSAGQRQAVELAKRRLRRAPLTFPSSGYIEERAQDRMQRLGGGMLTTGAQQAWAIPMTYDAIVAAVRARRKGQVAPAIPESYRKTAKDVRVGQALLDDVITTVANTLVGGEMKFSVVGDDGDDKREQERVVKVNKAVKAIVLGANGRPSLLEREAGEPFYPLGIEQGCADGKAIWELACRQEKWSELYGYPQEAAFPLTRDGQAVTDADGRPMIDHGAYLKATDRFIKYADFPFQVQRVDPLCYDEWKTGGKALEAIKIEMRPRREVYPTYGVKRSGSGGEAGPGNITLGEPYPEQDMSARTGQKLARCVTFWKADPIPNEKGECAVCWVFEVDGLRVDQGMTVGPPFHPLPFFPFNGIHTSLPDPAFQGVSVAYRLTRIADSLDTLLSMKFNVAALFSLTAWKKITKEGTLDVPTGGDEDGPGAGPTARSSGYGGTFSVEPGVGYELAPGEDILPIVPPPEAIAVLNSLKEDLMEFVNLVGLPAALRGVSPGSGSAGYMVAQLIAAARTKLAPILKNGANALSQLISYLLWSIEHKFPEGVPYQVGGVGSGKEMLTPEDIDGRYACELEIEPLLPVDKLQQDEASLTQMEKGVISMRQHRLNIGVDDPDAMEEQVRAERIVNSPLFTIKEDVTAAVRRGLITPQQGEAYIQAQLGIGPAQAKEFVQSGLLLGPDGAPLPPAAPPAGGTPGVPGVPGAPPIAPPVPDMSGLAATAMMAGGAQASMPQPQPDLAAAAVGS